MREFRIPVSWRVYGTQVVTAQDLDHAIAIVEVDQSLELPSDEEYIDGTFQVDYDLINQVKEAVGEANLQDNEVLNI
jgi:hypothetical protein